MNAQTEKETRDYFLKALYYAWGRQDAGADVNAIAFANCYRDNAACGRVIGVKDSFDMFMNGKRDFRRD